jgi:fructosamine-3-kinase
MNDSDLFGVANAEAERFRQYQSRVFFSKADGAYPPEIREPHIDEHRAHLMSLVSTVLNDAVMDLEELPRRTLHYVYRVRTAKASYIVRINACAAFYREFQFAIEKWATETLKAHGIPTMTVHAFDITRNRVPFDFEILDDAGSSIFDRSKNATIDVELTTKFGAFVATLHAIRTVAYGPFDVQEIAQGRARGIHDSWPRFVLLNAGRHLEACSMAAILDDTSVADAKKLLSIAETIPLPEPVLLHGDLAHHNAFTDGERITTLIDWEDCISGDPVFDIAYYATGCFGNVRWYDAFLNGYRSVRPLPSDFTRRFTLYYLRIAIAKALVRERFGTAASVHLPHITDRIRFAIAQAKEHGL